MEDNGAMEYQCKAMSVEGFIQQLAVCYVGRGYWFYVEGWIPETKSPEAVDEKLIEKYGIDLSKYQRCRRKRAGYANMQYIRSGRYFLLLATHGVHDFFEEEAGNIKDVRRRPIKYGGYSVSYSNQTASVRIEQDTYKDLRAYFLEMAVKRSKKALERDFRSLPLEPYAPVRRQLWSLFRLTSAKRKTAALPSLDPSCLRLKRKIYKPFEKIPPILEKPEQDTANKIIQTV
ncbi:hypothetical protein [Thiocystis violacea]|uniref:hypothetical protein n=1 Tax=Thiocystis violacea TaxID=13725 RepID=UPI0019075305|nr:hypothetical protein [Thiocystis violacea]MBK1724164.1 hypothetical protein [Thiocystis violacea]